MTFELVNNLVVFNHDFRHQRNGVIPDLLTLINLNELSHSIF